MKVLETERLDICHLSKEDTAFILDLVNSPTWIKFIGDRGIKNESDALNYILTGPMKSYEDNGFGLYIMKLKDSKVAIGLCGLLKRPTLDDPDIGFAILPEYEGKGYTSEAAKAVMTHSTGELGIQKVVAITMASNEGSINLLKKIGLKFEKKIVFPPKNEELLYFST